MKVFAHAHHTYEDRATKRIYTIPGGEWRDLPDEVGNYIVGAHPGKLCDVTGEANPDEHTCPLTGSPLYERRDIQEPPQDTMATPRKSAQRRAKEKAVRKRSLRARREQA